MTLVALTWLMTIPPAAAKLRHRGHIEAREAPAGPRDNVAVAKVPLPQPRPAEAPQGRKVADGKGAPAEPGKESAKDSNKEPGKSEAGKTESGKDAAAAPAEPPPPSACRVALTDDLAVAPSVPAIHGPGACGGDDLVRLEAVVLPDKHRVALTPAGVMRCTMATAVVNWIRNDVAPEVAKLGTEITALDNFDSYQCRGRNGVASAPLSEHGRANAIDVHGFKLADGRMIELTDRTQPREFRETVLHSLCTRFPTVLGPDSDWHHEDHIHIDLIERRTNYRICQWDVLDPMPKVAPLMPEVRPDDAPPREMAEAETEQKKGQPAAKGGGPAPEVQPATGKAAVQPSVPDEAKKAQATPSGKAAPERGAQDAAVKDDGQTDKRPPAEAAKDKGEPASLAKSAAKTSPDTAAKPSTDKPSTAKVDSDKTSNGKAAAEKSSADKGVDKPSADKASTAEVSPAKTSKDKTSKDTSSKDTNSKNEVAKDKASASKKVAHRSAPTRRRHGRRDWNPFGAFF